MNTIVILCVCAVAVFGAPIEEGLSSSAVELIHETDARGQYTFKYVTKEGTVVTEVGRLVPTPDGKGEVLVHEGSFTFIGDDGKTYVTHYKTSIAGAYEVSGDHLPKPVEPLPVPEVPVAEIPKVEEPALVPSA